MHATVRATIRRRGIVAFHVLLPRRSNTGISCRASTLAPRAVSFIPLFYGTLILEV
jgi:hypothetical protein